MIVQKGFGQWFIHDMLKNPAKNWLDVRGFSRTQDGDVNHA